jgi:hypothetical protein
MFFAALLLAAAAPAETPPKEPERYATLTVFGNDACPKSRSDEILVCARLPESERYRIPGKLRGKRKTEGPASVAWSKKVESLEFVSRVGTPNSCSPVGSGGLTGCFQQFMRQAREEREAAKADAALDQP